MSEKITILRNIITTIYTIIEHKQLQKRMGIGMFLRKPAQARFQNNIQKMLPPKGTLILIENLQNYRVQEMIKIQDDEIKTYCHIIKESFISLQCLNIALHLMLSKIYIHKSVKSSRITLNQTHAEKIVKIHTVNLLQCNNIVCSQRLLLAIILLIFLKYI